MKMRIHGNSIRLRLSRSEVEELEQSGRVGDKISFGPNPNDSVTYGLEADPSARSVFAHRSPDSITIFVPKDKASEWTSSELVGFEGNQDIGNGDSLSILVEKDFQCLQAREGEDESGNFPNPLAEAGGHPECSATDD